MNFEEFCNRFPARVDIPVQWGEQDGFGHVNNAVFIRWLEASRIRLINLLDVELKTQGVGPILASVSCNFRRQVKFPDTITSGARVTKIGRSSLQVEHGVWSETQRAMVAEGDSTVVLFNYELQKSSRIPDELRQKIAFLHPELEN